MNKKFKKSLSIMTSVSMALGMMSGFPLTANAEDEVPYIVRSWNAETRTVEKETAYCSDYTVLRSGTKKLRATPHNLRSS